MPWIRDGLEDSRPRTQKKSKAKDCPFEDRPDLLEAKDTGASVFQNKKKVFKNFFQAISKWGKQKGSSKIFREVSGVFQQNFKVQIIVLSLSFGQGNLFWRSWGFKAKDLTFEAKDFKMRPQDQGRPRGLHLCSGSPTFSTPLNASKKILHVFSSFSWNWISPMILFLLLFRSVDPYSWRSI